MNKEYWYNKIITTCPTEFLIQLADLDYEETQSLSLNQEKEIIYKTLDTLTEKQVEIFIRNI